MFEIFQKNCSLKIPHINQFKSDINLEDNISAYSDGHFNEKSHSAKVTGYD